MTKIQDAMKMRRLNVMRDRLYSKRSTSAVNAHQAEALRLHREQVWMQRREMEASEHRHPAHIRIGEQQNAALESIAYTLDKFLSIATADDASEGLAGLRGLTPPEIAIVADKMATHFVCYQFPENLYVDGGLSLRPGAKVSGTNLLTHAQAKDMFMHLLVAIEGK